MNKVQVTLDLIFNNRVTNGLYEVEHLWTCDEGFAVYPRGYRDGILATLDVDARRYDSEGDAYIINLLQILPGDLIHCEVNE